MYLSSLLSAGALGVAVQAFLIPEVNNIPSADNLLPTSLDRNSKTVNLDCSTCPYALNTNRNEGHEWTADVESDLEMKFDSDGKVLKFNGVPFYPISDPTLPPILFVSQKKKEGQVSNMEGFDGNLRISYSMEYDEKKFKDASLVTMTMTVMGLDGQMIRVDNLEIKAFKSPDGTLKLLSITPVTPSPDSPDAKCENVLCRVFTKLLTGVKKAKSSAKGAAHKMKCFCVKCFHKLTGHKHPHHHKGMHGVPHRRPDGNVELPSHIHVKPAGQHGHHGHHHHHRGFFGRMIGVLRTTFKVVLIPILIGVAFGMAASALGMVVGQAIVFLWMKFRRTPEAAYEPLDTDEKDAPPAYQDVPASEAVSEKEVEAKA
ncbi:hypothetical protein P7C71_g451, partial [Lecanoromycetidae sp. Uapishka_2]